MEEMETQMKAYIIWMLGCLAIGLFGTFFGGCDASEEEMRDIVKEVSICVIG